MCLVNNDRVVGIEEAVPLHLRQQDAVCHQLDGGGIRYAIIKANGVADRLANVLAELVSNTFRHGASGQPSRLGMSNHASATTAHLQKHFGNLGGFTRTGFTRDHHNLVVAHGCHDVIAARGDGKFFRVGDFGHQSVTACDYCRSLFHILGNLSACRTRLRVSQTPTKPAFIRNSELVKPGLIHIQATSLRQPRRHA